MMTEEKEQKLQRILKILTLVIFVFTLGVVVTSFDIFQFTSTSVLHDEKESPKEIQKQSPPAKKKVRRLPLNPETVLTPEILGDAAFAKRDFSKAEAQYELARQANDRSLLRLKYVRSLLAQRKIVEAKGFLDEQKDDTGEGLQLYRGIVAALLNQPEESQSFLKEIAEKNEKARVILRAYEEVKFTVDGKPEHLQTLLAKAFDEIGEYELAVAMSLDAIKSKDDYRDAWVVLGHAYLVSEKWGEAESALEKALSLDSEHPEAHLYLSFTKRGLKKWKEAFDHLQKAEQFGIPMNTFLEESKAEILYETGDYQKALPLYENILREKGAKAKPEEYIRPLYLLLEVFDKKEKGLKWAQTAVNDYPEEAISYNLLGWASLVNGKQKDAEENLEKARILDPTLPAVYFNLGRLAEYREHGQEAKNHYETALQRAIEKNDQSIASAAKNRLSDLSSIPVE